MKPIPTENAAPDLLPAADSERSTFEINDAENVEGKSKVSQHTTTTQTTATPYSADALPDLAASLSPAASHGKLEHSERHARLNPRVSSPAPSQTQIDGSLQTVLDAFVPHVAVFASDDTDELARGKGLPGGFYDLLSPYSEDVQGKVIIRDSNGASKAWDDFSIRLIHYGDKLGGEALKDHARQKDESGNTRTSEDQEISSRNPIDELVGRSLFPAEDQDLISVDDDNTAELQEGASSSSGPAFVLYLRKILSGTLQVPHEAFCHPVACIIAVSSRSSAPLEKIRQLYAASGRGNYQIPPWVSVDYLRYYVLVHDEDHDDIIKSTALFDLMKRHFGIHCFLLRIRSERCSEIQDDIIRMPQCLWRPVEVDLAVTQNSDNPHDPPPGPPIFDSDAVAIRGFIREMVTQSIIPFMESRVVAWNEQVGSKRRGIGGRFMSLSKRWTSFGSSKSANATGGPNSTSSGTNFDPNKGYYAPEQPEAIMRQLADYSFMLRDYRLAHATYDTLRSDFFTDKAWAYHASASEFSAVSLLLIPQALSGKSRSEVVDQRLDAALYSYLTRCSMPYGAVRSLLLAIELLAGRGSGAAEDAAKWAVRSLELGVLSPTLQTLLTERVADIQQSQSGVGVLGLGSRKRKSVLWNILASSLWMDVGRSGMSIRRLRNARAMTEFHGQRSGKPVFPGMYLLYTSLEQQAPGDVAEHGAGSVMKSFFDQDDSALLEMGEPSGSKGTFQTPEPTDASGFSTVEAAYGDFGGLIQDD
ncbi:MAG: hypothetical protein Q9222_000757 [Ikaeria aurantiellina]